MKLRDKKPIYISIIILAFCITSKLGWYYSGLQVLINLTPSMPKGFYLLKNNKLINKNDIVVFRLPSNIIHKLGHRHWLDYKTPLLKPVTAITGDRVCTTGRRLTINGKNSGKIFNSDYLNNPLPRRHGCIVISSNKLFLVSNYNRNSFDSRYFGAIKRSQIIATASPILIW